MDKARDTFVARFGEDQAAAVEMAAHGHFNAEAKGVHDEDRYGSQPFKYWFLLAIGYECVTRYRSDHGITADVEAMREWAKSPDEGDLGSHDGDVPDYLAVMVGAYNDWIRESVTTDG